jgi:hypothetical protein
MFGTAAEVSEGRSSFLKKRSKRLLFFQQPSVWPDRAGVFRRRRSKSLLVLFFRKEHTSFLPRLTLRQAPFAGIG